MQVRPGAKLVACPCRSTCGCNKFGLSHSIINFPPFNPIYRYDQAGKLVAESGPPHMRPQHVAVKATQASSGTRRGDIVTIALVPAGVS